MKSGVWKTTVILGILVLVLVLVNYPTIQWRANPSRTIDIAIIDKSVSDMNYNEHKGLTWILNQQKIRDRNGYTYVNDESYYGFNPSAANNIQSLPSTLRGKDLIYAADTYGIYKQEQQADQTYKQKLIYGGMKIEDVQKIQYATATGTTFIGEYNILGAPTDEGVRQQLENMLGIHWSGWKGRYYSELADVSIPMKQGYALATGKEWAYQGEGILFIDEKENMVVLDSSDLDAHSFGVEFSEKGYEWSQMKGKTSYHGWFDIVEPRKRAEVLAEYTMDLSDAGAKKLKSAGIPDHFPAITRFNHTTHYSYYFSGDYANRVDTPYPTQYIGWDVVMRFFIPRTHQNAFYWEIYVPVMKQIFSEIKASS
ncbi:hypothetical protein [Paenibacillus gallinarum]|uniref:Uncharacterized protein n=1 Tax=Paenibacillus gallinarum TaxID=2762232 RepID=A0ABR8SZE9_9BACL|nr:hypothetical protein [Paenibacillus gallinarum]MBD7968719.1 hypothetical protein [Paenibacillus gallinarum]